MGCKRIVILFIVVVFGLNTISAQFSYSKAAIYAEGIGFMPFGSRTENMQLNNFSYSSAKLFSNYGASYGFSIGALVKRNDKYYLGIEFGNRYYGGWKNSQSEKYNNSDAYEWNISPVLHFNNFRSLGSLGNIYLQFKPQFSFYTQNTGAVYYEVKTNANDIGVTSLVYSNQYKSFSGTNAAMTFTIGNAFNLLENWKVYIAYEFSYIYYSSNSIENSRFATNGFKIGFFRNLFPKKTYYY